MKKKLFALLVLLFGIALFSACGKDPVDDPIIEDPTAGALSYDEFMAAELESEVTIAAYIQDKQIYAEAYENTSLYLQDEDGGYFVYRYACTAEEYEALKVGALVKITGTKTEWAGEVEVKNVTAIEIYEKTWKAEAKDVTDQLGKDDLVNSQNRLVSFKDLIVAKPASYSYNGTGDPGDDLYLDVNYNGTVYTFCVESDYQPDGSACYDAVEALKAGDIIDVEGFLYWYNGAQPHLNKVTVKGNINEKSEGVMSYDEYLVAEADSEVTIEAYIQGKQIYADTYKNTSLYLADADGAYFVYRWGCTAEEYAALNVGDKVKVTGIRTAWAGEEEIKNPTVTKVEGPKYIAAAKDVTNLFGTDELVKYNNQYVVVKGAELVEKAMYKYDGSGEAGDDLYYKVKINGAEYTFCVESDYQVDGSECYDAVEALEAGQVIDIYGILYWYNGPQPHTSKVVVK